MSRQPMVLAVVVGALLLGACSGGDDAKDQDAATTTTAGDGGGTERDSGEDPKVAEVDAGDVVAEQTFALSESPEDTVTVGVQSLRVQGEVMELRLVLTPHFESVSDNEVVELYDIWEKGVFLPLLIDMANLKEYSVISDAPLRWTSDSLETEALNGRPMVAFAMYAAPEDDIDTIELRLREVWPSFADVPIER